MLSTTSLWLASTRSRFEEVLNQLCPLCASSSIPCNTVLCSRWTMVTTGWDRWYR